MWPGWPLLGKLEGGYPTPKGGPGGPGKPPAAAPGGVDRPDFGVEGLEGSSWLFFGAGVEEVEDVPLCGLTASFL